MKLMIGPAASGKTTRIFRDIASASQNAPREKVIYIVPEQVTMKVQKQLILAVPGHSLMGVHVLSFKRLAYQVLSEIGTPIGTMLSDTGKCMVLLKIARDHQDELQYYSRNVMQRGFIGQMKLMITEIIQYGLTEETLRQMAESAEEGSILRAKLSDIALLWHYFLEYTTDHVLASESLLDVLAQRAKESRLIREACIYIDDFSGFTVQEYRLIRAFVRYSRDLNISLSMTQVAFDEAEKLALSGRSFRELPEQPFYTVQKTVCKLVELFREEGKSYEVIRMSGSYRSGEISFVTNAVCHLRTQPWNKPAKNVHGRILSDPQAEVKFVFRTILERIRDRGMTLSDIAIMVCDADKYDDLITREASLYGLPVFVDRKIDAAVNPYIQLIEAMGELPVYGYSTDTFLKLLKTGLCGVKQDTLDQLENLMIARNTFGLLRIRQILEESEDEELISLSLGLAAFEKETKGKRKVSEITDAYIRFIERFYIREQLDSLADFLENEGDLAGAVRYRRIYDETGKVLDQLMNVLSDLPVRMEEYTEILKIGLEQLKLGQVPPSMDELLVGDMRRTRLSGQKVLILMGLNSGSFPWPESSPGLLTNTERGQLQAHYELAAGEKEKLSEQYYLLYLALGKAGEEILLTCSSSDGEGKASVPSIIFRRISSLFPDGFLLTEDMEDVSLPVPMLYDPSLRLSPAMLSYLKCLGYQNQVEKIEEGKKARSTPGILSERVASYLMDPTRKRLSVTQLEKYASCPFAYYLGRALRLQERQQPQVRALEDGNVIHDILEEAGEYLKKALPEEEAGKLAEDLLKKREGEFAVYQTSGRYRYYWQKLQKSAARAFEVLSRQAALSDFTSSAYEWAFGGIREDGTLDRSLSKVQIGSVSLAGKIDRIDVLDEKGQRFVRVIDYKTGRTGYDPGSIYEGLTLQLPVYLNVASKEFDARPAGFFYFHISQPTSRKEDLRDLVQAGSEEGKMKTYRLDGVFLNDEDIARKMDHSLEAGSSGLVLGASMRKDGTLAKAGHKATEEQMADISRFVEKKISELAGNMAKGQIDRKPVENACKYCEFRRACPFDPKAQKDDIRQIAKMDDDEFFEAIRS
ncbi:MAG: PD-(D/E)XK nuclease family protein [Firmicutes bacterium]|nr:PD-(D/E)XK nuclease family protein [Bacillota bacterium]